MPFNGSGTYSAPSSPGAFNPAITGQNATPAAWNTLLADISTALSTTITKDGQTTITQNIPFAAKKITDLGNATALTDALNQQGAMYLIESRSVSAQSVIDFTGIPATVNNLFCQMQLKPSVTSNLLSIRTYGADGVLDTGASDYYYVGNTSTGTPSNSPYAANNASAILWAGGDVENGNSGVTADFSCTDIQALLGTNFLVRSTWFNASSGVYQFQGGAGGRKEADRITGFRIFPTSGTMTGRVTLFASV